MVVEYSVHGSGPTKAQAIEEAKKWIASECDAWWNKKEAIIFLEDLRFVGGEKPENSKGAHYRFADRVICPSHSDCFSWHIGDDNFFGTWVWLPFVGQDASLEVPDSERMFHVVVVPYGASTREHWIAPASLANIKEILEPFQEAYWSKAHVRAEYVHRHRDLWEKKGSDNYSFVFSIVEDGRTLATRKIVVRNGEVVEIFSAEDGAQWVKVWPNESETEYDRTTLETQETSSMLGIAVNNWLRSDWPITDLSFDYEFGYPTAALFVPDLRLYASEYTPLDD